MSFCSSIATNDEMPLIQTKSKVVTVKEAIELELKPHELMSSEKMDSNAQLLYVEKEEDLNE